MHDLRVTLVQSELSWEDKSANLARFDRWLSSLSGTTDLVILPEMFTTGFSMNAQKLAEDMEGPTISWLAEKASALNAVITGSFIAREDDHYFNRLVWMPPDGRYKIYDKRHLFTLANEHRHYSPGKDRLLVNLKDWKILPLICYDLRFPVWSRNTENYDLLIYVANFPQRRSHAWKSLLIARAIENQAYTIGLNRVGTDGNDIYYSGNSSLIDYAGRIIYQLTHRENVFTTTLAHSPQQAFRSKLGFLADQDHFTFLK